MKKLLLSLGTVAAVAAPVATVVACGSTPEATKSAFENSDYGKIATSLNVEIEPTAYATDTTINYEALKKELSTLKLVGQTNEITSEQFLALGEDVLGHDQAAIDAVTTKLDWRANHDGIQHQYYFKKTPGVETPILDSLSNKNKSPEKPASILTEDDSVKIISGTEESIQTADFYLAGETAAKDKGQIGAFQRLEQGVPSSDGSLNIVIDSIIDWEVAAPAKAAPAMSGTTLPVQEMLSTKMTNTELGNSGMAAKVTTIATATDELGVDLSTTGATAALAATYDPATRILSFAVATVTYQIHVSEKTS